MAMKMVDHISDDVLFNGKCIIEHEVQLAHYEYYQSDIYSCDSVIPLKPSRV
jgi:hypothetical protein